MDVPLGERWFGQEGGIHFEVEWRPYPSGSKPRKTRYGTTGVADILNRSDSKFCPKE